MTSGIREILLSQRFFPDYGGSINWLYETYRRWPNKTHLITHQYQEGSLPPAAAPLEIETDSFTVERHDILMADWGLDSLDSLSRYYRMNRAVSRRLRGAAAARIYCTHAVPEASSVLPLRMLNSSRFKLISYAHGEEILACETSRQLRRLLGWTLLRTDLVIANSHHTAGLLTPYAPRRVEVIHPGVDWQSFQNLDERGREWRRREQIPDDACVLLSFGRLEARKNHRAVVEAIHRINKREGGSSIVYYIVGSGTKHEGLLRLVDSLSLKDSIRLREPVSARDKAVLLSGCDIFVLPAVSSEGDTEGFGMVFLEAAAAGRPSIAGRAGGQPEAVLHGETGLVVDGSRQEEVTEAIAGLAASPERRRELGERARRFAKQFDWPETVAQTYDAVERI